MFGHVMFVDHDMTIVVELGVFGGGGGTYVIEVKLDLVTDIPCYGRVRNVELPVSAYVDLVDCWCDACC